ncbi:MAG: response regulator transcription factor [Pirellulales bacterium]
MSQNSTLFIVEDDAIVRDSLKQLANSSNIPTESYSSADEFMLHYQPEQPGCLILDMQLPGTSKKIKPIKLPAAFEFLEKPCNGVELLRVVKNAFLKSDKPPCTTPLFGS